MGKASVSKSTTRQFRRLSNVQHVRMRTGMWLGQNSLATLSQHFIRFDERTKQYAIRHEEVQEIPAKMKCLDEACMNAIDEYNRNLVDRGVRLKDKMTLLEVELSESCKVVVVRDNGRGIPQANAEHVFLHLMYGENFDDQAQQQHVSGQNGVGISLVRIVSKHFRVATHHDGQVYRKVFTAPRAFRDRLTEELGMGASAAAKVVQHFDEHGELKTFKGLGSSDKAAIQKWMREFGMATVVRSSSRSSRGTEVEYELDPQYFSHMNITYDVDLVRQYLQDLAMMNPGLEVRFRHQGKSEAFCFKKGLEDILGQTDHVYYKLRHVDKSKNFLFESYLIAGEGKSLSWVNSNFASLGGSSIEYFENRICDLVRKKPAIQSFEKRLKTQSTRNDVRRCFHMVNRIQMLNPRFKSQDKSYLINDLNEVVREVVESHLDRLARKIDLVERIKEQMQKRTALKAMDLSMKGLRKTGKTFISKLIDTTGKASHEETILFVAEGDSAVAGLRPVRDPHKHALFPLKGKPLNVKGMPIYKTLENEEMKNIISALNLPIDRPVSSTRELKYSKVSVITDADYDGYAIRSLMFSFFLEYWPELFSLGCIYMCEAPLYEVEVENPHGKRKTFFCIDETAFEELTTKIESSGSRLVRKKRNKGLGETSKQAMAHALSDCMRRIEVGDLKQTKEVQELWFHKQFAAQRRSAISEYSQRFLED